MAKENRKGSSIKEGLADLAQVAERDHEVAHQGKLLEHVHMHRTYRAHRASVLKN